MAGLGLAAGVGAQGLTQALAGVGANRQASRNARILEKLGVIAADDERARTRAIEGAEVTEAAKRGGDPTTGSNLDIAAETAVTGSVAERRARFGFDAQAHAIEVAGRAALIRGITSGVGSVLGGATRALGQNPSKTASSSVRLEPGVDFRPGASGQPF